MGNKDIIQKLPIILNIMKEKIKILWAHIDLAEDERQSKKHSLQGSDI